MQETHEPVAAVLIEGATVEDIERESRRQTEAGQMCIIFPAKYLLDRWVRRIAGL
jgi:hypothetical protein